MTQNILQLRDFTPSDRELFLEMATDFFTSPALLHPLEKPILERTWGEVVSGNGRLRGLFLECNGQTAGFALVTFYWSTEVGGLTVHTEDLYILPEFRGQKLGERFFGWLEQEYPAARRFALEVTDENPAQRLYTRLGYRVLEYRHMIREPE